MALGADPITDLLATLAKGTTASVVDRVVINTRYGKQIVLQPPSVSTGGEVDTGEGGPAVPASPAGPSIAAALQPEILLYLKGRTDPVFDYAPYGPPGETQWPWVRFVLLFGVVTVGYYTYKGVTRPR